MMLQLGCADFLYVVLGFIQEDERQRTCEYVSGERTDFLSIVRAVSSAHVSALLIFSTSFIDVF